MEEQEYIDVLGLAHSLRVAPEVIGQDIRRGDLVAEKRNVEHGHNKGKTIWFIRADHAQTYSDWIKRKQQSITVSELAKRTGQREETIRDAIHKGDLVAIQKRQDSRAPSYILETDARAYSERMGWPYDIPQEPLTISATELQRRAGRSDHRKILDAIKSGELPATRPKDAARIPYQIPEAAAREFCERMGWPYSAEGVQPHTPLRNQLNGHTPPIDPSDRCNACGSSRNVVGHMHKGSRNIRGYLCTRCQRVVDEAQEDIDRLEKVLAYLRRTHILDKAASSML